VRQSRPRRGNRESGKLRRRLRWSATAVAVAFEIWLVAFGSQLQNRFVATLATTVVGLVITWWVAETVRPQQILSITPQRVWATGVPMSTMLGIVAWSLYGPDVVPSSASHVPTAREPLLVMRLLNVMAAPDWRYNPGFWAVSDVGGQSTRFAINAALFAVLANQQTLPVKVETISVFANDSGRDSIELPRISAQGRDVFFAAPDNLHKAKLVPGPFLDRLLSEGQIEADGGEARGWLLVRYPAGFRLEGASHSFRLTVVDVAGRLYVADNLTVHEGPFDADVRHPFFEGSSTFKDLTALPIFTW
jgi:hypothetical protein